MNELGDTTVCVIGNRPHPATVGLLCDGHYGRLSDTIRDIVVQTEQLSAVPSMAQTWGGTSGGGLKSHRSPVRLDVLTLTDRRRNAAGLGDWDELRYDDTPEVLNVLGSWARVVREERGLTADGAATVVGEAQLLTGHLEWVAGQAWADEAYEELRRLLSALKRVNGDPDDKPVAKCTLPVADGPCGGPIWINGVAGVAECGRCGSSWTGKNLVDEQEKIERAKRPVDADGVPMQTARELASHHKMKLSAIRQRLHRLKVKPTQDHYYSVSALSVSITPTDNRVVS